MKKATAWTLLTTSSIGAIVCMVLWLNDAISDRAMLGLTLLLSWLALIYAALDGLWVVQEDE